MIKQNGTDIISIKYVDENGKIKAERTIRGQSQEDFELKKAQTLDELLEEINLGGENRNGIVAALLIQTKVDAAGELKIIRQ